MDELFRDVININTLNNPFVMWQTILIICHSFVLGLIITWTYRRTHNNSTSYSQNFAHTLIIMNVVISIVIFVIGSNIARAFSLAGALSIIRFRSAIREPRDVAFIFFSMASGVASGTGNYLIGTIFAVLVSGIIYGLHLFNYGEKKTVNKILKITVPENLNYEGMFDDVFSNYLDNFSLVSVQTTNLGTMFELTYIIKSKSSQLDKSMIDEIRCRNSNLRVSLLLNHQNYFENI